MNISIFIRFDDAKQFRSYTWQRKRWKRKSVSSMANLTRPEPWKKRKHRGYRPASNAYNRNTHRDGLFFYYSSVTVGARDARYYTYTPSLSKNESRTEGIWPSPLYIAMYIYIAKEKEAPLQERIRVIEINKNIGRSSSMTDEGLGGTIYPGRDIYTHSDEEQSSRYIYIYTLHSRPWAAAILHVLARETSAPLGGLTSLSK